MELKPKILIVDDDPAIGQMLTVFLGRRNYQVNYFTQGEKALDYLKSINEGKPRCRPKTPVDNDLYGRWLLLTDLDMPEMTGIELTRQVKTLFPALPVIVMSGSGAGRERDEIFSLGADFIAKPFDLADLLIRIQQVV